MAETAAPSVRSAMPALALNEGVWEGTYRSVTSRIVLLQQWDFRIEIALSDDRQVAYRQRTTYTYPDGAVRQLEFTAQFDGTRIHWANERFSGLMWEAGPQLLIAQMRFANDPNAVVDGIVRMAVDGSSRSRIEKLSENGRVKSIMLVDERRVD